MSRENGITFPCAANAVAVDKFIEQDGAGAMKEFDGTGVPKGYTLTDKDANNNVGAVRSGLIIVKAGSQASINVGDVLEGSTTGAVPFSAGTKIGFAAETKSVVTSDNLLVQLEMDLA